MRAQTRSLPYPSRERWQPLRSGFVNLYRYDNEEFHYENGRLLLRGNNGTGKSRVLALQLPFLLDGDVNPQRMEPDADPSKKVEWNLLMGRYPDRTGYTWIEFGRCVKDGGEHYFTLGCGLSAVEGQPGAHLWFFITTQRIGKDLELVSPAGQVLGDGRLREKIGSAGQVFETAGPYRRAVNEALFRLDEYRYASLVNLLIQLRRPQLTRQLDEYELSRALSEALPPVSPAVIANVAEAFRTLRSDRTQLDSSKAALAAVEQFLTVYRCYAQIAAKRRAGRVLAAHYEYEAGMKEILIAEAECDRSLNELARLKAEMRRLSVEEHALQAEITAFQKRPQTADAHTLEQAHREATERRRDAECAAAELADASAIRKSCAGEHVKLRANLEQRRLRLAAAIDEAVQASARAGLEHIHRDAFGVFDLYAAGEFAMKQARERIDREIHTQIEKMEHAGSLNERVAFARNQFQRASAERDQLTGLLDDARERLNRAHGEHRSAITSFLEATSDWTADLSELTLPFDEAFLSSVTEWCERPHGPNPFAFASRKAVEELSGNLAEKRAHFKHLEKAQTEELTRLETQAATQPERLLELQAAVNEAQAQLDLVIDSIDELNRRESILRSEACAAPSDEGVRAAYEYSVAVAKHMDSLRSRMAEAEESALLKQSQLDQIVEKRDRAVADLGIGRWVDELDSLKDGITHYRIALSSLWPAVESFQEAQAASEWAWMQAEQANAREARQKQIAEQFERRATAAEIALDAAGHGVDAGFGEIVERVAQARQRLDHLRMEEKELRRRYHDTEVAVILVDERLRNRTEVLNGQTDRRDSAASSLLTFASTGLLQLAAAGIAGGDALKASTVVEVAFNLAARLDSIDADDSAWERYQRSVPSQFNTLMQGLCAQGCQSSATFQDDLFVATAVFAGREYAMQELRQILFDDVAARQMLLDAREREILENHLVGKVSCHLRELLRAAEQQVEQMNVELESRPMSTGMKLRFVWRLAENAPSGVTEARQRLMQLNDNWSLSERQMLGLFLHRQIQAACSDIEGASWHEALAEALDYRKWHWFGVERYQDGVWKRLTRRTHGTGSGGEKAVALTLPHFAAAAAFYRTADSLAPRLILLDEAFVGIDADMRAKCMGLIHTFDLDFMMTSEREWGCYQTLPGMAIYQLSTRPGIDAIGLTRWVWNGRQRSLPQSGKNAGADASLIMSENRFERVKPVVASLDETIRQNSTA
jgi:hypothetical protein